MKNRRLAIGLVLLCALSVFAFGQARNVRPEKARDPVCGILVVKDPELSTTYNGQAYYFCSRRDLDEFKKNPRKYVK